MPRAGAGGQRFSFAGCTDLETGRRHCAYPYQERAVLFKTVGMVDVLLGAFYHQ